ncbi:hypothetical protein C8A05DRAFT_41834 [Staphylotrichum tortipilum]|uniref:Ankyrin repeat protein n=1 Tax=Staphylotrichum tortipilum TaxID=2831512 RepID=A0AAN6MQH5_9PEZI|nr:hypothetical protein C8A05DRAFT_41834 [Staphylotrichum longicolle]
MKEAYRGGFASAIRLAVRLGASVSAVPVGLAAPGSKSVPLVGGGGAEANPNPGEPVVIKALTLQLAAKARRIDTFSQLVSLGARLDEPGTSGRDAPDLLRLFFPSGPNVPLLARQLSQELCDEALLALLEGYNSPFSSQAVDEYIGFASALLDAGASSDLLRGSRVYPTPALSAAVKTFSPDLVRFFLDRGACPDGPPSYPPRPITSPRFHRPLCTIAHALATSLLDAPTQATLRQMADMLLDRGADINTGVPCIQYDPYISFTNPLLVLLDTVDCWDDDEGSLRALDALRFLLARGSSPDGPPRHPAFDATKPHHAYSELFRSGRYTLGRPRIDPFTNLLKKWGIGMLASPAFASALELLVGHPGERGGVPVVAITLAEFDSILSSSSLSSPSQPTTNGEAVLGAWTRLKSLMIRNLTQDELGEFLYAYVVRVATCPMARRDPDYEYHQSEKHQIGNIAKATVTLLLAAGADMNHLGEAWSLWGYLDDPNPELENGPDRRPTALHAICVWLAGSATIESFYGVWSQSCRGFRNTPSRTAFIRFLVETCGADPRATYLGRTPAELLVQMRRPKLDEEETEGTRWRTDPAVVEEGRRALLAVLENPSSTA